MLSRILLFLYKILPVKFRNYLGSREVLKPWRDLFLRPDNHFRETKVRIRRRYLDIAVSFDFYASVKVAAMGKGNGKSPIKMVSLDLYVVDNNIEKCDLVKIDVDGIEYAILKGAEELIKRFRPTFIVETNGDMKLIEFLENRNYKILDMKLEVYKREDEIPENVFCVPR